MAHSPANPLLTRSPNAAITAAKSKTLTVLRSAPHTGSTPSPGPSSANDLSDLSAQLNEAEKQKWVKGQRLGEGTYAIVYKAHLRTDPTQLVAIKKIKVSDFKDGLSMDAIREVKYLQELRHPNIISLLSVFSTKDQNLNLVMEFLPQGDLKMLIQANTVHYGVADIKAWMGMLGRAVWFCHQNFVLHRDIKPDNLLIAADGEIKLADFGLATSFKDPYHRMTSQVITSWYRPPELYFGARYYSGAVDVWSLGCVFAELVARRPFLPSESGTDLGQIHEICRKIGTPTNENWPGVSKLEAYITQENAYPVRPKAFWMRPPRWTKEGKWDDGPDSGHGVAVAGEVGVDLMMKTMILDPRKRVTATEFLQHEWFKMDPKPTKKENLPRKAGGEERMGEDLKRRGGELEDNGRGDKVARKLDFGAVKK